VIDGWISTECWCNGTDRGNGSTRRKTCLSQCPFVHHTTPVGWPGTEPGPPWWKADVLVLSSDFVADALCMVKPRNRGSIPDKDETFLSSPHLQYRLLRTPGLPRNTALHNLVHPTLAPNINTTHQVIPLFNSRAMPQRSKSLTAEVWVRFQVSPCYICGRRSVTVTSFSTHQCCTLYATHRYVQSCISQPQTAVLALWWWGTDRHCVLRVICLRTCRLMFCPLVCLSRYISTYLSTHPSIHLSQSANWVLPIWPVISFSTDRNMTREQCHGPASLTYNQASHTQTSTACVKRIHRATALRTPVERTTYQLHSGQWQSLLYNCATHSINHTEPNF
jgi:hypothetical protein